MPLPKKIEKFLDDPPNPEILTRTAIEDLYNRLAILQADIDSLTQRYMRLEQEMKRHSTEHTFGLPPPF